MSSPGKRIAARIAAPLAAGMFAVCLAPSANADANYDGYYFPVARSSQMIPAHLTAYHFDGDLSRPTGRISVSNGCTIDIYAFDPKLTTTNGGNGSGIISARVTSGASSTCRDSERMNIVWSDLGNNLLHANIVDMINNCSWDFKGPANQIP
jgi:hypothetical protein